MKEVIVIHINIIKLDELLNVAFAELEKELDRQKLKFQVEKIDKPNSRG